MKPPGSQALWQGLSQLTDTLRAGKYWTDRRDACEAMLQAARQIVLRTREAAEDKDPDVAHWGNQACRVLQQDMTDPIATLGAKLESEWAKHAQGIDAPTDAPVEQPPAPSAKVEPALTKEALFDWIGRFAAAEKGSFKRKGDSGALVMPLKNDRRQTVQVDLTHKDSKGAPVVLFYSICGEADPGAFEWSLKANSTLSRGAFGVIEHQSRKVLILLLRRRIEECPLPTLAKKLRYLAQKADWAEARLRDEDRH